MDGTETYAAGMLMVDERPFTEAERHRFTSWVRSYWTFIFLSLAVGPITVIATGGFDAPRAVRLFLLVVLILGLPVLLIGLPTAIARTGALRSGIVRRFTGQGELRQPFSEAKAVSEVETAGNGLVLSVNGHRARQMLPTLLTQAEVGIGPAERRERFLEVGEAREVEEQHKRIRNDYEQTIPVILVAIPIIGIALYFKAWHMAFIMIVFTATGINGLRSRPHQKALLAKLSEDDHGNKVVVTVDGREYLPQTGLLWRDAHGPARWRQLGRKIEELEDAEFIK